MPTTSGASLPASTSKSPTENDAAATYDARLSIGHWDESTMSVLSREEISATCETIEARTGASEARMATAMEAIRADSAAARAEMVISCRNMEAINESIKAQASVVIAEIHRDFAANKAATYALGYKIMTWIFGTLLTLMTAGLAIYKAWPGAKP